MICCVFCRDEARWQMRFRLRKLGEICEVGGVDMPGVVAFHPVCNSCSSKRLPSERVYPLGARMTRAGPCPAQPPVDVPCPEVRCQP